MILCHIIMYLINSNIIDNVYAGYPGILGVFEENFLDLTKSDLHILKHSPGSASIGTSRVDILNEKQLDELRRIFNKNNIKLVRRYPLSWPKSN